MEICASISATPQAVKNGPSLVRTWGKSQEQRFHFFGLCVELCTPKAGTNAKSFAFKQGFMVTFARLTQ